MLRLFHTHDRQTPARRLSNKIKYHCKTMPRKPKVTPSEEDIARREQIAAILKGTNWGDDDSGEEEVKMAPNIPVPTPDPLPAPVETIVPKVRRQRTQYQVDQLAAAREKAAAKRRERTKQREEERLRIIVAETIRASRPQPSEPVAITKQAPEPPPIPRQSQTQQLPLNPWMYQNPFGK
jgi:hypothetical protein